MTSLIGRYLDAKAAWMRTHGDRQPARVYISEMTRRTLQAMNIGHVEPLPIQQGRLGLVMGCEWYVDDTMAGDGFRFEEDIPVERGE